MRHRPQLSHGTDRWDIDLNSHPAQIDGTSTSTPTRHKLTSHPPQKMTPRTETKIAGLRPELIAIIRAAWPRLTEIGKAHGIRFEIISGNRTQKEQDELYAQGRTKPGRIVTWTRNSRHIGGRAFDLGCFDLKTGEYLDDAQPRRAARAYTDAGKLFAEWKLTHGRKFGDDPHFQL